MFSCVSFVLAKGTNYGQPKCKHVIFIDTNILDLERYKHVDAEETPGHPMAPSTLKQRLTTQFQSAALDDPEFPRDRVNALVNTKKTSTTADAACPPSSSNEDPRLTPEMMAALAKLAENVCTHCGGMHKSHRCWNKFPALKPEDLQRADIRDAAHLAVPMF